MLDKRNRTPSLDIDHALYLYFLGLSTRSISKAIFCLRKVKRSHVAVWKWIQKYHPRKVFSKRKRISEYIVDETLLKVGSEYLWLWVAINRARKQANSRSNCIQRKEYAYRREIHIKDSQDSWETYRFY